MPSCEKCWDDAFQLSIAEPTISQSEHYARLLESRQCTPEEQAGGRTPEEAGICPACNRRTMHRVCNVCMACGYDKLNGLKGQKMDDLAKEIFEMATTINRIQMNAFNSGKKLEKISARGCLERIISIAKKGQGICTCPARHFFNRIVEIIEEEQ